MHAKERRRSQRDAEQTDRVHRALERDTNLAETELGGSDVPKTDRTRDRTTTVRI